MNNGVSLIPGRRSKDFGHGFYVTTRKDQAVQWANNTFVFRHKLHVTRRALNPVRAAVVEFEIDRTLLGAMNSLVFLRPTQEWEDFVLFCRADGTNHAHRNTFYDVVYGPVSVPGGTAKPNHDQISFHSQGAVSMLMSRSVTYGSPRIP